MESMATGALPYERALRDIDNAELLAEAVRILNAEADCLTVAASRAGDEFVRAARAIAACRGRVVVVGIGKSGHVGRKIAATLASLGTPAFFLHAVEGAHGDLGMVCRDDVGMFLSNSGETQEVLELAPYFRRIGAPIIGITGNNKSSLAAIADVFISCAVTAEADPLGLAPTSSTTLQMALGDALAGMVTRLLGLAPDDFAMFHPAGTLGKRLLTRISDVMGTGERFPCVRDTATVREALFEITSKGYGATAVVDSRGGLCGIFTDGDLRRLMEKTADCMDTPMKQAVTHGARTMDVARLAADAVRMMEQQQISVVIATDEHGKPVGMVHIHDMLKIGLA